MAQGLYFMCGVCHVVCRVRGRPLPNEHSCRSLLNSFVNFELFRTQLNSFVQSSIVRCLLQTRCELGADTRYQSFSLLD